MEDWKRPVNKYTVALDGDGSALEIDINVPKLRAENLHFQTWGSARILAENLYTIPMDESVFEGAAIDVLELGAGTGLAGLAAAALWKTNLILTDLGPFVPGLSRNIDVNREVLAQRGVAASAGTLDWEQPHELPVFKDDPTKVLRTLSSSRDKASMIIAADCLYSEDHPRLLVNAIVAWLKPGSASRVIICYPLRIAYLDIIRELWELLESEGLESISEGKKEIPDKVWDDERLHEWGVWRWRQSDPAT
jgi:predicted nicotinamide N-methyase